MNGRQNIALPEIKNMGTYDVGLDSAASIFEILIKRLTLLCETCKNKIPVYVMSNSENKAEIKEYFKLKNYFEYGSDNVFFFSQELAPIFNENGQIALREEG